MYDTPQILAVRDFLRPVFTLKSLSDFLVARAKKESKIVGALVIFQDSEDRWRFVIIWRTAKDTTTVRGNLGTTPSSLHTISHLAAAVQCVSEDPLEFFESVLSTVPAVAKIRIFTGSDVLTWFPPKESVPSVHRESNRCCSIL